MTIHAFRLHPGQDLKHEIEAFTRTQGLSAGFVLTCVGSLRHAALRPADENEPLIREEKFEIVSLAGTLSPDGAHLHIALSDRTGRTLGGHLLEVVSRCCCAAHRQCGWSKSSADPVKPFHRRAAAT